MLMQGIVGSPNVSIPDTGSPVGALLGKSGEFLVSELHGKYYTSMIRGNIYTATTVAAGLAIPINTTTAPLIMLWNPAGSGKVIVPIRMTFSLVSGTAAAGAIMYQGLFAGSPALNNVVTAFADNAGIANASNVGRQTNNNLLGNTAMPAAKCSTQGTNTIVTTTSFFLRSPGIGYGNIITTSTLILTSIVDNFDGEIGLLPGMAMYPVAVAASSALFQQSITWEEVPL